MILRQAKAKDPAKGAGDESGVDALTSRSQLLARRGQVERRIKDLGREQASLVRERRTLDRRIALCERDRLADAVYGPVAPEPPDEATPTPAEVDAAGEGILKRDGTRRKPRFVTLLGHTVSVTAASYAVLLLVAGVFLVPLFGTLASEAIFDVARGGVRGNLDVTVVVFVVESVLKIGRAHV